jgi:actin-related protein
MDVKTHALDRLFEALSPALAAELERVAQETREAVEREFESRMQAAIRDAEASAAATTQAEVDRAVQQAKDDVRREVTAELEKEFEQRLETATAQLKSDAAAEHQRLEEAMTQQRNEWSEELNKVEDDRQKWRTFAEAQRHLGEAASQPEMLARFLSLAQPFAQSLGVYVAKPDGLALWQSKGKGVFPKIVSRETTDPESFFRTISVRGRTLLAVSAVAPFDTEALEFLVGALEHAIEAFGLRLRTSATR